MTSPILLSAIVGASVSLFVAVSFSFVQKMRAEERSGSRLSSKDEEVWE
jgi:hypothetical protein